MNLAELFKEHGQKATPLDEPSNTYNDLSHELRTVYDLFELIVENQGTTNNKDTYQFNAKIYSPVCTYLGLYNLLPGGGHHANFSVVLYDKNGRIYDVEEGSPENVRYKINAQLKGLDGFMEKVIDGKIYNSVEDVKEEIVKWVATLCPANSAKKNLIYTALSAAHNKP